MLGLIFLRFADATFAPARDRIEAKASARRTVAPKDYHASGVIYIGDAARFGYLLDRPEGADLEARQHINSYTKDLESDRSASSTRSSSGFAAFFLDGHAARDAVVPGSRQA